MAIKKDSAQSKVAQCIASGTVALSNNDLDQAVELLEQASQMLRRARVSEGPDLKICHKSLAEIYFRQDKCDKALKKITALREIDDSQENRRFYVNVLHKIAEERAANNDRQGAEEAYGLALSEATQLLPPNDPLTRQLNTACLEIFKRTIKFKAVKAIDQQVVLSQLPTEIDETAKQENEDAEALAEAQRAASRERRAAEEMRRSSVWSGNHMPSFLHSHLLLAFLSLLLIGSFLKAALVVPVRQSNVHPSGTFQSASGAISPASDKPLAPPLVPGSNFVSCDRVSSLTLTDGSHCQVKNAKTTSNCTYQLIGDDWLNFKTLLQGHLRKHEICFQLNESGLIDNNRTALYTPDAPELKVADKMVWYADMAQKYLHQKHFYPSDVHRCKKMFKDFGYINPFTFREDEAAIISLRNLSVDPCSALRPADDRAAPHWRAGAISCFCVDGNRFFIHGYDHAGTPLTSSDPARYFVVECRDGINVTQKDRLLSAGDNKENTDKDLQVFICSKPEQATSIRYCRSISCIGVWLFALMAGLWCFSNFQMKQGIRLKWISAATTCLTLALLVGWYVVAYMP